MKLDHCLFGYDDGHRLIASSLPLGEELSLLTELSDLAPGTIFGDSDGYWTGLPVASLGRYILMRTWPAPEMSRPGCVWTHALLIEPSYLELIEDLSILKSLVVRPFKSADTGFYRKKIDVEFSNISSVTELQSDVIVRRLILSLYGNLSSPIEINSPGELDAPLFSVWSQQWPRLRRNFRFQTAAAHAIKRGDAVIRFDATALLVSQDKASKQERMQNADWLSTAVSDALDGEKGSLRSFLWRYGSDVRRQRGSFKPLVDLNILDHSNDIYSEKKVVEIVSTSFPELSDAMCLKQDLINGEVVPSAHINLIKHMLSNDYLSNYFPEPTEIGLVKLKKLWPLQADDVLQIINSSVCSQVRISKIISTALIEAIETKEFWLLSTLYPDIRREMVKNRPEFLFESEYCLDDNALTDLIPAIPSDACGVCEFINALLKRESSKLIDCIFEYFPDVSSFAVIYELNKHHQTISENWKKVLMQHPEILLRDKVMGLVSRTSLLLDFAHTLGMRSAKVINAGITPWYQALLNSEDDVSGDDAEIFGCFLLVLACKKNEECGPNIIENYYNLVHKRILNSKLSTKASELLYPSLPDIGWLWNWDHGQRFRIFVAKTYIKYQWSPESFSMLAKNKKGRSLLADTVSKLEGGERYFDAVSK
jgi:hypothetical protein